MDPLPYIDLYCERTAAGFWNEPFNALSNLAFLFVSGWAMQMAHRRGNMDYPEKTVLGLAFLIGIESFLFHTFANGWSEYTDVVPIWSFVTAYVVLTIYRATGENLAVTLRIAAASAIAGGAIFWFSSGDVTTGAEVPVDWFNGSLQYTPALVALLVFAIVMQWKKHPARNCISAATLIFLAALLFRTIDLHACDSTKVGTHFLWHILDATMIGVLLYVLVRHMPPKHSQNG